MLKGTAGSILVNDALPGPLRDHGRVLDKRGTSELLSRLAKEHPGEYAGTLHRLMHLGLQAAYWTGGQSFGLDHLRTPPAAAELRRRLQREAEAVWNDPRLTDRQRDDRVAELAQSYQDRLEAAVYDASVAEDNPLGRQVASGSRGNKSNLRSLRGADLLYVDHKGDPVPVPVLRSYSEGLRPHEYFAGSFGSRAGLVASKLSVADVGFMGKQLGQASHRLVVTARDADGPPPAGPPRGLPVATDDPHNEGAALAHEAGGYPRNTILTPAVLSRLRDSGLKRILVRSPTVGGPPAGGVYGLDAGVRERGRVAPAGDFVGLAAAQALSESLTQSSLSSKHNATGVRKSLSGFPAVNQMVQAPRAYQGATHAQVDGRVQSVEPAPQGGLYVTVENKRHHLAHGLPALVKAGDEVEAGDALSEGLPNPAEVVRHKGVGEGRRYLTEALRRVYKGSGAGAHRRNVELVARGLVDHVRLTAEHGGFVPDDVVPYSRLEAGWEPRPGHRDLDPRQAKGMYLEAPALHYTVGTLVRPSVVRDLQEFGVKSVLAHPEPPPFEPVMVRGMATLESEPDWMVRLLGSYGKKNLLRAVHRGDASDELGTSYVPSLARGVDFNRRGPVRGFLAEAPAGPAKPTG